MDKLTVFGRIVKVDLAKHTVEGIAMDETPDRDGEIYDYNSSKPYVQAWAQSFADTTKAAGQEVSYGNVRSMHSNIAAGKLTDICFSDHEKSVPVTAKVLDDEEWKKVESGVYTGFSVKGRAVKKWRDGNYTRYTVDPIEISLVDMPCNPGAKFLAVKADGTTEERDFQEDIQKREFSERRRKDLAESGKALPDGSFPIENKKDLENAIRAIGRAKDPEAARKHIIARAKDLGATDMLPADWDGSTKEKVATAADIQKLTEQIAELQKRLTSATVGKEHAMTPEEIQKAAEIKKAAAIEKMKAAHKLHNEVGSCLHGYCDHGDTEKCMAKAAEAHEAYKNAFSDKESDEDEAEKAAKAAELKKASEKAEILKRAKELGISVVEEKSKADPKVAELEKTVKELKEQIEKGASVERKKPVLAGKSVAKADDFDANDPTVKKFAEIKKDDTALVAKTVSAIRSAEPVLVD